MNSTARVSSIDALAAFREALIRFGDACADSVVSLQMESRRGAEWIEVERVAYWPAQARQASDDRKSAEINLERCEQAIRPSDRRSCYEQKKAVEQAKARMGLCEEKVRVVRKWAPQINQAQARFPHRTRQAQPTISNRICPRRSR